MKTPSNESTNLLSFGKAKNHWQSQMIFRDKSDTKALTRAIQIAAASFMLVKMAGLDASRPAI